MPIFAPAYWLKYQNSYCGQEALDITITVIFSDPQCHVEENNGFLKYVCYYEGQDPLQTLYKCLNSEEYYEHYSYPSTKWTTYFFGNLCSMDPHFYQACNNQIGGRITNNEILCEH